MRWDTRPSPNHDARPAGITVDMVILHYTGMADEEAALQRLCDPEARVSAHWFVRESGEVVPLVDEDRRAWHAGVSSWAGRRDINACSVGIEIHNPGHDFGYPDFPARQIEAVIGLCREIVQRHPVPPHLVLGHSDVAPARKVDPGEKFPWQLLHENGVGHWVAPAPRTEGQVIGPGETGELVSALQGDLADYGYGILRDGIYDHATEQVVAAFQRHFRPSSVDGRADVSTRATLRRLLSAAAPRQIT